MKKVKALTVPEGDGVVVNRLMPVHGLMNFDPFVLMDHFDIEGGGFPDHPHRGFEAITYMLGGGMQHVDNLGNTSTVHAGGLQRFTAGKGIVHSEMPEGRAQGIQLWINLPKRLKQIQPSYQQVDAKDIPEDTNDGVVVRTVVGQGSPTQLNTKVLYLDVTIKQGSVYQRFIDELMRGFVYVLEGEVSLNQESLAKNEAMFFDVGETLSLLGKQDIRFALDSSADYIILDGRGGGTGAAPEMFRDHISVPTIPALARARRYLDEQGASGRVTLIITGGLRVPIDFVKAMALGADGVAISNSAMQAIGCVAARMCNSNNCPSGIATQKPELRKRLNIERSAKQLANFFNASTELMQVMTRACGHHHFNQLTQNDLATWHREMALLSGVKFSGVGY